jgi:outer membrane protein OmpA-like peptidoglycan-associated protein
METVLRMGTRTSVVVLLLLVGSGCATKGWVEDALGRQGTQVDQRFATLEGKVNEDTQRVGTLETRSGEQASRLDGTDARLNTLQSSLGDVRETAETARGRADTALKQANAVDTRLTNLWASRTSRTPVETFEVLFRFNRADLSDAGQTLLHSLAQELKANEKLVVELTGYADPTGPADYNVQLSQRRVEAVRRYLVGQGVPLSRITAIGMGALPAPDTPKDKKRRVTVTVATLS